MPKYNVEKAFWRHGLLIEAGQKVSMTASEAKYLGHIVTEAKAAAPEVAPAPIAEEAEVTVAISVTEAPASSKRSKRQASADHVDSSN